MMLLAAVEGCGSAPTNDEAQPGQGKPSDSPAQDAKPVATLTLPNGNIINFYDVASGAFVTEQGDSATSVPTFKFPGEMGNLASSWRTAAPSVAVPQALLNLEARFTKDAAPSRPGATHAAEEIGGMPVPDLTRSESLGNGIEKAAAALGYCGNNCCDTNWLKANIPECNGTQWADFKWSYLDYGWSYVHQPNDIVQHAVGSVCAAQGYSTFIGSFRDYYFNQPVAPGQWLRHEFVAGNNFLGGLDATWFNYDVNSTRYQHGHAFCGWFWYYYY
jgi:hypothetical protein